MPNILPRSANARGVKIQADRLDVSLDSKELVRVAAEEIAKAHREAIPRGEKADGTGSNMAPDGGRDKKLAYESGELAKSIKARVTGGKHNAKGTVAPHGLDAGRYKRLSQLKDRVMFAGDDGTPLGDAVNKALLKEMERQIK